jgi:hypothetical protein
MVAAAVQTNLYRILGFLEARLQDRKSEVPGVPKAACGRNNLPVAGYFQIADVAVQILLTCGSQPERAQLTLAQNRLWRPRLFVCKTTGNAEFCSTL